MVHGLKTPSLKNYSLSLFIITQGAFEIADHRFIMTGVLQTAKLAASLPVAPDSYPVAIKLF